ncbi:hypothetical protein ABZ635_08745 [Nocardiopsis sp. NPDC007018]|uniref:hypothetical protein n=1 Tax=Nocardiopsis sp. NPDC007018 TaxID=3155721 RepID=UPI0033C78BC1
MTDDGLNWWNIAGDAAFAMSFIPGLQWVGFALGAGVGISKLFSSGQKNVDGIWDIAGALPFGIGKGSRFLARSSVRSNAADFFSCKSSKRKQNSQAVRSRYNSLRGDISSSRYYDSVVQGTAGMIGGAHDFVTGARAVEDPGWSWAA